jgi:hypothetical protein
MGYSPAGRSGDDSQAEVSIRPANKPIAPLRRNDLGFDE